MEGVLVPDGEDGLVVAPTILEPSTRCSVAEDNCPPAEVLFIGFTIIGIGGVVVGISGFIVLGITLGRLASSLMGLAR